MTWMEISGTDADAVSRALEDVCAGKRVDRVDASDDRGAGLSAVLGAPSLFGAPDVVVVAGADRITAAYATAAAASPSPSTVVFTGGKGLSAAVRKKLPGLQVQSFNLPAARGAQGWCQARAREFGVALPRGVDRGVMDAVVGPVGAHRFDTALAMLASIGCQSPSVDVLEELLRGSVAETPIWVLSDAVARGDLPAAVKALGEADPIAALSVATTRVAKVAFVLAHPELDPADVAKVVGGSPAAARMLTKGVSVAPERLAEAFDVLVGAEVQCRSGRADTDAIHHVVLAAIVRCCALLARP